MSIKFKTITFALFGILVQTECYAEKRAVVQKMNFDGADVSGKKRQPDGSYVVQKRGVEFVPLYKLKENFDEQIESSVDYIK